MYSTPERNTKSSPSPQPLPDLLGELSSSLGLPLALSDSSMIPVASMPHEGALDRSRLELLMGRSVPHEVGRVLDTKERISAATEPKRIEPFAGLELGRVHIPLRGEKGLVGHLWAIDPDSRTKMDAARDLQQRAEIALATPLAQLTNERQSSTIEGNNPGLAHTGAPGQWMRMVELRVLPRLPLVAEGMSVIPLLDLLHTHAEGHFPKGEFAACQLTNGDYLATLSDSPLELSVDRLRNLLIDLRESLVGNPESLPRIVGVTSPLLPANSPSHWRDTALGLMTEIAINRAGAGQHVQLLEDDDLFDLLSELGPMIEGRENMIPPSVTRLLSDPRGEVLAETVKAFLDLGGSVVKTARRFGIHRGTLYYRLEQVEEITGLRLADGRHRLLLHLGLILSDAKGLLRAA